MYQWHRLFMTDQCSISSLWVTWSVQNTSNDVSSGVGLSFYSFSSPKFFISLTFFLHNFKFIQFNLWNNTSYLSQYFLIFLCILFTLFPLKFIALINNVSFNFKRMNLFCFILKYILYMFEILHLLIEIIYFNRGLFNLIFLKD